MKNTVFKLLLLNCMLVSLSSCLTIERRTNFIVPGEFYGENLGVTFYLNINKISKDNFDAADGLNVLEDFANPNNYYSIYLYYVDDDNEINLPFENFKHTNTPMQPVTYIDDHKNYFTPMVMNKVELSTQLSDKYFYSIDYNRYSYEYFVYFKMML